MRHGYRIGDMERLALEAGFLVESIDGVNRLTLAETEKRYTTRGASWVMNNIRMSWRARERRDFAVGDAFKAEPQNYASIGAVLKRPVEPARMQARSETIEVSLPKVSASNPLPTRVQLSES